MSKPIWYRSLYWRIALGLVVFIAVMLAAQGLAFIYLTDRLAGGMPTRSPRQLALVVASDIGEALEQNPKLDVEAYVRGQFGNVLQPFVIRMRDGRLVLNRMPDVPEPLLAALRLQAERQDEPRRRPRPRFERDPDGPLDDAPRADGPPFLRPRNSVPPPMRAARRRADFAAIFSAGVPVGIVAVPLGRPPFSAIVAELGPTMALVGAVVLIVGSGMIALVVFRPAQNRLRQLQDATIRLGAGDLDVRAPTDGGDEVAELARSFNRMAEDLAARARALESSDRARRQLLADVSHELMTPLTAMRGYIETLAMKDLPLDVATRERYLGIVDEETRRLEHLIGDLLDLARLESGGPAMRTDTVPTAALFDRVAARHERELAHRGVRLIRRIAPGAEHVEGDPDRLEQALQNLAGNALRHTQSGGEISLGADVKADSLLLTVRDTGAGIPPEHLPLIFDRFYKADASRRAATGSGLGLSIVKAIVERHGGSIAARNDSGAVFEILLPRQRSREPEAIQTGR